MNPTDITYKSSGIDWLGDIPSHWEVRRLKYCAKINPVRSSSAFTKESSESVVFLPMENVSEQGDIDNSIRKPIFELWTGYTYFERNDILIAKITPCFENGKGALLDKLATDIGFGSTEFHVLRANEELILPRFLYLITRTHFFRIIGERFMAGAAGQKRITTEFVENFPVPLPAIHEQEIIIDNIDRKTEAINAFLSQKQRFIDLLREQKQAIINEAVTKGIYRQNSDNHLVTQGDYHYSDDADWLKDTPGHWEVRRLKNVVIGKLKYGANESGEETNPNYPRYIRITDFDYDGSLKVDTFRSLPPEIASEYSLTEGDILFARSGATVGKTFQFKNYNGTACFAGYLIRATPNVDLILSDFLYYYTNSNAFENWKNAIFNKATIENIGADKYNVLPVPVPPLAEQADIVAHIEWESERIDKLMNTAKKQVAYMQEYRSAMIAESVTGGLSRQKQVYKNIHQLGL